MSLNKTKLVWTQQPVDADKILDSIWDRDLEQVIAVRKESDYAVMFYYDPEYFDLPHNHLGSITNTIVRLVDQDIHSIVA